MSRMTILGYREQQVLLFVCDRVREQGIAPSYRMIRNELGISTNGEVCRIVKRLENRGYIRRDAIDRVVTRQGVRRIKIRLVNALTIRGAATA